MKQTLMKGWDLMRVLRLALGIFIIAQGIQTNEWLIIAFGVFFTLMPLFNMGCCGAAGCNIPDAKANKKREDIKYEEVR